MNALTVINIIFGIALAVCYVYQFVYMVISYVKRKNAPETDVRNRIAILVAARNEERVISRLLNSINAQDYPMNCFEVFVVADNCTDKTAEIAAMHGATVFERFNTVDIGKGYALDFLLCKLRETRGLDSFDAFLIFDADNSLKENYLTEINKTLALGYDCVTSYRASCNYSDSWVSAGQGMCFLRDTVLLNRARMAVGGCCFVSGTGYAFTSKLCREFGGGWPFHTLTEDCEFSMYNATRGSRVGYSDTAVFYDEQATRLFVSCKQRLRWCKGGIQVFTKYFKELLGGIFSRRFVSCFDMSMCMTPAYIISVSAVIVNAVGSVVTVIIHKNPLEVLFTMSAAVLFAYFVLLCFSIPLTISEWRLLGGGACKKILYAFTVPIFMFTFIPVAFIALFKRRVVWTPIAHGENKKK